MVAIFLTGLKFSVVFPHNVFIAKKGQLIYMQNVWYIKFKSNTVYCGSDEKWEQAVIISADISLRLNVTTTQLGGNLASYRLLPSVVMKCDSFPLEPDIRRQFLICPQLGLPFWSFILKWRRTFHTVLLPFFPSSHPWNLTQVVMLLTCIRKVPGLNLDQSTH
jgi:hypothetical protein